MSTTVKTELRGAEFSKQVAADFATDLNRRDFDPAAFAWAIRREHRTIQQTTFKVLVELLHQWSQDYDNNNYDLRNEDAVKGSARIMNTVGGKDNLPARYI
jgi:hypothetical protein